jgi:endoglucanase
MTMTTLPRILVCTLTLLSTAIVPCLAAETPAPGAAPTNPSGFVIHRGTNLSHWLSQDFGWTDRSFYITGNDIRFIARCGFDHVRLPIDEKEMWSEDGKPIEASFTYLHNAIEWCAQNHLRVIVDLHSVRAHDFNAMNEGTVNTLWSDPKAQKRFLSLWAELSRRLREFPNDLLAYEIMNEPTAENPEDWNKLVAASFKPIRAVEPGRVIVIGADMWQIPQMVPALKVPEGDKNIIISFHTYSPMALTHHMAGWIGEPMSHYTGAVNYPGPIISQSDYDQLLAASKSLPNYALLGSRDNWNADRIRQEIEPALKRAKELGLQLYCGEYGCLPTVPREARLAYYKDITGVFESEGIAWANWEYKGQFGILEWHDKGDSSIFVGAPDTQLIDILMGK